MPRVSRRRRAVLDWADERPVVSVSRLAGVLGIGWRAALHLLTERKIRSYDVGTVHPKTSMKDIRAFLDKPEGGAA